MVVFSPSAPPILAFVEAEFCTKLFSRLHGKAPKHEHVRHGGIRGFLCQAMEHWLALCLRM